MFSKLSLALAITACLAVPGAAFGADASKCIDVGTFPQEVRTFHQTQNGLIDNDVLSVAVAEDGVVYAGTAKGLCALRDGKWAAVEGFSGAPVPLVAAGHGQMPMAVFQGSLRVITTGAALASLPPTASTPDQLNCLTMAGGIYLGTAKGLFRLNVNRFVPVTGLNELLEGDLSVRAIAAGPNGELAVAAAAGLFYSTDGKNWQALYPKAGKRSWAPSDVRGVAFDAAGKLWFASPQGCGALQDGWTLYTGQEGLPYDDFTSITASPDGKVWFGTKMGALHFDGDHWAYRQGLRWLPHDEVRDIAVDAKGNAWCATSQGVGCIGFRPMTLAEKANFYEDEIDRYNRRTEFGYVLEASLKGPGDKSEATQHDSDNDGLWTAMYGAGECFAYAATKDPKAKARAKQAFEALRQLYVVTQGGSQPSKPGFVARTILPVSGHNPNETHYTAEKDRKTKEHDQKWKVLHPRWPVSADGKWYYKCDTSSDELDGHYFLYALYYDLVADTEAEKARVRELVCGLTDHMVEHGFNLVDWDGTHTRWAVFGPKQINHDVDWWAERGLNSLSMLSYLSVAEHISGDAKYRVAADTLVKEHSYAMNTIVPKVAFGAGSGNQSDDEMAFMSYYNLLNYEKDPELRNFYLFSFARYWMIEEPEMNPFFNYCYDVRCDGQVFTDTFGAIPLSPRGDWLKDSAETLVRFPLDRLNWRHDNSKRIDIIPLSGIAREGMGARGKGHRVNGKVIPVDESFFNHWNCDQWALVTGGGGNAIADGAVFLLPYYMGLYHGYVK